MGKQKVYVMIGIPGSGKDTWIKNNLPDCKCISRDDIYFENKDKMSCPDVYMLFFDKIKEAVSTGEDVIINSTNILREDREVYKEILKDFDVEWVYVLVKAPSVEVNIERRRKNVRRSIIYLMHHKLEHPTKDEYDEIIKYTSE